MPDVVLPRISEPVDTKDSLNQADHAVREATLRQASDIATPVYHEWRDQLNASGVTWQSFQSAASATHRAWRGWLAGELAWPAAVEALVEELNQRTDQTLVLAAPATTG